MNHYRKLVAHWAREGRSVHENGRFRGQEVVFEASVHKKWRFCGREVVFEASVHKKWRFCGRECDRQKRDTLERMSP